MSSARLVLPSLLVAALAAPFAACSSSSTASGDTKDASTMDGPCSPPPLSCDAPAPSFFRVDGSRGCVETTPVTLTDICSTSVNRCAPSGGIAPACAIAPDGTFYVQMQSDNYMYSANGWHFDQPYGGFPDPAALPADQRASAAQLADCQAAECLPFCDAGGATPWSAGAACPKDAGGD